MNEHLRKKCYQLEVDTGMGLRFNGKKIGLSNT